MQSGTADGHRLPAEADAAAAAGPQRRPLPERPAVDAEGAARVRVQETMAVPRCKHRLSGLRISTLQVTSSLLNGSFKTLYQWQRTLCKFFKRGFQ